MAIMFMLITVIGILVGEVGAEVDWKDSRSTVSEFSLECDAQRGSIVQDTAGIGCCLHLLVMMQANELARETLSVQ